MKNLVITLVMTICVIPATAQGNRLMVAAQANISAILGKDNPDYFVETSDSQLIARNPRHNLQAGFSPAGVDVRHGDSRVGMKLRAYGYGDSLAPLHAATPWASLNRVEYRRRHLVEWYVNGPAGLEQGFTLERSPGNANGQPLTLALTLSGDLVATIDQSNTFLTLTDRSGHSQLRYGGLSAHDVAGNELPVRLELQGENVLLRVNDSGARYPLVLDPWIQLAELTSSDGRAGDEFGFSVAISGDTVVVGASEYNSSKVGAAYVFVKGPGGWNNMTQTAKLTASDAATGALFGSSVACLGHTVVVGAPHASVGSNQSQGEAYVFVEPRAGWANMTETARLTSADGAANDYFGYAVSESGTTIAVGAPQASGQVAEQGKAYIFVKPKGGWKTTSSFNAELTASNAQADSGLGVSVSISGSTLVAGAAGVNSGTGAAYVFVEPEGGWKTTSNFNAELTASDGKPGDDLGYSVSISDNTVAAGAYLAQVGSNLYQGAAYVFIEPPSGWANMTETAKLTAPDGQEGSEFGYSLSLSRNTLVVGSSNNPSTEAAYLFVKPRSGWMTTSKYGARLTASDGSIFSFSVAVDGGTIVSGSIGNNSLQGAAYVFGK
jgi:hypothetical protein